jgi:SAM-dependent methyltransferase
LTEGNDTHRVPERFEPGDPNPALMRAEHWARYQLASALASGKRILDAGCGTGYGTRMLEDSGASEVTGIDVSAEALTSARKSCRAATLCRADLTDTGLASESFDLITCFEVIEHLEAQDAVIAELHRLLAPDGLLMISSPNRDVYLAGNPHHVHELTPDELDALIAPKFENIAYLRQHPWMASAILGTRVQEVSDPRTRGEAALIKVDGVTAGHETYTIAVASNGALPEESQLVALCEPTELDEYVRAIKGLEVRVAEDESALEKSGELRVAADQTAEAAVNRQREAEGELRASNAELQATREHLARANAAIESITHSFSWRVTKPLRGIRRR